MGHLEKLQPVINHIDIRKLSPKLRGHVLKEYSKHLRAKVWVSLHEAAWLYGYQPQSLRQFIAKGSLPSRLVGGRRMVRNRDMLAYLRANNMRGQNRKARRARQTTIA